MAADKRDMCIKEAVCVHTKKVYDSCKDKDCLEDLRVYPTRGSQEIIDRAINVKCRKAELLWVYLDVESVPFNRGFYTVDVKYFYRITADAFCGVSRPTEVTGLATFDKRVILFGSEGNSKIFSSQMTENGIDQQLLMRSNMPTAVVEVVDPICLGIKLLESCHCGHIIDCDLADVPSAVCNCFEDDLVLSDGAKRLYVSLGQFSIIKLERDSQLLMPAYDFCMPDKECVSATDDDPCELFKRIKFPTDEFFPPSLSCAVGEDINAAPKKGGRDCRDSRDTRDNGCGCR
ncbi:hypothetical protein LJC34_06985 [Oscillospiraceae bacterium OttesenSCG-928-G22]|nr:hypothetical protein [Oscillospiraceae bacterium OttesenSCG-928-G22]